MPLTSKGEEIKSAMTKEYGTAKGERVFYASKNKGTISGVDAEPPIPADYATKLDAVASAMVRLGSRMDALCSRLDADDTSAERNGVVIGGKREVPR
jgi:hypothetical protein